MYGNTPMASSTKMAATDAVRMSMSEHGPGHILVVPYFNVQAGKTTTIQLVNSDSINGKAVKLNFRGATNGDSLMSFQLLLAPGDVWVGTLSQASGGGAQLTTTDKSCTVPRFPTTAVPLLTNRLNPKWPNDVKLSHTREGYMEAIVMADIPSVLAYGSANNARSSLFNTIKPVDGAAPCTSSVLESALLNDITDEATAAGLGFSTPTTGLLGTWSIADAVKGVSYSGTARAFSAVDARGNKARGNFMVFPQTASAASDVEKFTSDPLLIRKTNGSPAPLVASQYDLPDLSTPYYLPASEANSRRMRGELSGLLGRYVVRNQFVSDPARSMKTDWVFTMPTKRYYVGVDYSKAGTIDAVVRPPVVAGVVDRYEFSVVPGPMDTVCDTGILSDYKNREAGDFLGSPSPRIKLCGATSVVSFSGPDHGSALAASLTVQKPALPSVGAGWASLMIGNTLVETKLPGMGFSFSHVSTPATGLVPASSVGMTWAHVME